MTARLIASWFGSDNTYRRMADVLRYSAELHCPGWDIRVEHIDPPRLESAQHNPSHVTNTQKMVHWCAAVARASDGDQLLLMDGDTFVLRELDPLWSLDFDVAYTDRPGRLPFNTGVVAVRVGPAARAFMAAWLDEQLRMLGDARYHAPYRSRFGGINQAALGRMLERRHEFDVRLAVLPGLEWNAEDGCWADVEDLTRIVHVKSQLRRAVFGDWAQPAYLEALAARWNALEAESRGLHTVET